MERWKRLMAAWNNVPSETAGLIPANDWTRAAWDRVYEAAINHYLEVSHERPVQDSTAVALEERAPEVLLVREATDVAREARADG